MTTPVLNLIVLRAKDPERLCKLYAVLGCDFKREQHGHGPVHYSAELGSMVLEIYPSGPDGPFTSGVRLGFEVIDIEGVLNKVVSMDACAAVSPIPTGQGFRSVITDSEGHKIELTGRH